MVIRWEQNVKNKKGVIQWLKVCKGGSMWPHIAVTFLGSTPRSSLWEKNAPSCDPLRGPPFSLEYGGHEFPKVPRQYLCDPLFDDQKFMTLASGAAMLEEICNPNARSAENMHFWAISLNKIFIKICMPPNNLLIFGDPPISHEKILWPPAFSWHPPPYSEENDSPLILGPIIILIFINQNRALCDN